MNEIAVSNLLSNIKQLSDRVDPEGLLNASPNSDNKDSFAKLMKDSLQEINSQQVKASEMGTEFQLGNKEIDTAQLMIEIQKARVSFEALNQFRNQVVSAYKDVMNMQI